MATTTLTTNLASTYTATSPSLMSRFIAWCEAQNDNRLLWLGVGLGGHGCILTPLTLMPVVLSGASLPLFILAIVAMGMVLVTNLAALPTKITIPVFVLSVIIDVAVVIAAFAAGINAANVF